MQTRRGEQLESLAEELKVSRSQIVEEALALFLTALMESKRDRRVAIVEGEIQVPICEVISPSLSELEWTAHREKVSLSSEEM